MLKATFENTDSGNTYGIPDRDLVGDITLRGLMSHTAGFRLYGVSRIPRSIWPEAENMSTLSWLLGLRCGSSSCDYSKTDWVWQDRDPRQHYVYSNGGYMVLQAFLEDHSGQSAESILQQYVFDPLGMATANADIKKSSSYLAKLAWQHDDTPADDWVSHPNILASNIYSNSEDYAKAMIIALNRGRTSNGTSILPWWDVTNLLSRQPLNSGTARYGFGVQLDNNAFDFTNQDFFHGGTFNGRARAYMCGNPTTNQGIVVLMNTQTTDPTPASRNSEILLQEILTAYVNYVGWPNNVTCRRS